ncbi:MAG TPA: DNA replication and repair protein RecF [Polyangia bacterium]
MVFTCVRADGWRNLRPLELAFDPTISLNVLYGQNGQGKTNLIEALYFLASFRSFRTSQAADLIQKGAARARIAADWRTKDLDRTVEVCLGTPASLRGGSLDGEDPLPQGGRAKPAVVSRTIEVDGKLVRRTSSAFGLVSVVLFVPDDLALARAAPAARRRFMDMAIAGLAPRYFGELATFQRVLRGRNALLRGAVSSGGVSSSSTWLETIDEQLARAGARVVMRRRGLVADMAAPVRSFFHSLHGDLVVTLVYEQDETVAAAGDEDAVAGALLTGLGRRRALDFRRRHTTFGPQVDDLGLMLGQHPAREHASQGQLRSLMLSLKLSELTLLRTERGEAPVLLLDDVPSELDPERRRFLFETLATLGCQTVLSVADRSVVPAVAGRADFHVVEGTLVRDPGGPDFALLPVR